MPVLVQDVLTRCQTVLQDRKAVRWPLAELADWMLDGALEIALQQPSATAVTVKVDLDEGVRQHVDDNLYQCVMRVIRNCTGDRDLQGRAITMTTREALDLQNGNWRDPNIVAFNKQVRNAVIDIQDPLTFWVYPGNPGQGGAGGQGRVELLLSAIPTFTGEATNPDTFAGYEGVSLPLAGVFKSAITDYTLYRAFSKDSQVEGAAARAQASYGLFTSALAARQQAIMTANANMSAGQPFA